MIDTIKDFCIRIDQLEKVHDAYYVFEERCTDRLRDQLYGLVDNSNTEPFRTVMHQLGFATY